MKILLTNWVNLLGIFLAVFTFSIVQLLIKSDFKVLQAILAALLGIVLYGMLFWILLIIALVILDLVLIVPAVKYLRIKLLIEALVISIPFIYWIIIYHEWIFVVAVTAFLITQLLREKLIINAISPKI